MTRAIVVAAVTAILAGAAAGQDVLFEDDFERPDGPVRNGWSDMPDNDAGDMAIDAGRAITTGTGGVQGIFRPLAFDVPTRVQATLTETDGNDLVGSRFESVLGFANGGMNAFADGYVLSVNRTEADTDNSHVRILDDGVELATQNSPFQFESSLDVDVTFFPNGSVEGSVTEGANVFAFSFGPHVITSSGGNFAVEMNNKASGSTMPSTLDDLVITDVSVCQTDLGLGTGAMTLELCGEDLTTPSSTATLTLEGATPSSIVVMAVGTTFDPQPLLGGMLGPFPFLALLDLPVGATGTLVVPVSGSDGTPVTAVIQVVDPNADPVEFSNTLEVEIGV